MVTESLNNDMSIRAFFHNWSFWRINRIDQPADYMDSVPVVKDARQSKCIPAAKNPISSKH